MRTLVELTRAPAALTVLGDTLVGAAAAGRPLRGRRLLLPLSSAALYCAGMALNDWADRELDAVERPERPISSGRITPGAALGVAAGLGACGVAVAAVAGRGARRTALGLAAAITAYDVVLKSGPAGPAGMALCRGLDVLLGAGGCRRAWPAAAVLAAHTSAVTALSRGEVHGARRSTARAAAATTALAAAVSAAGPRRSPGHRAAALAASAAYAAQVGRAQARAARTPTAPLVRAATRAGIHGMVPLQVALVARHRLTSAAALAAVVPAVHHFGRKVSAT
ncbi:SCO3242 family prenyltransferase [Saccharopolyspora spinosporotrichia]|uniref:SCO3242 family prenyltransferase n=3 Tax=Saccharopolyspora erythraea TaxID=1836 RepID=UPI0005C9AF34|nr:UbiA family prenyltransferase [Saccharopolyspora erythraea]QRK93567.1 UbiA family prenyltransferase [Saccharopolyspora erythraea]